MGRKIPGKRHHGVKDPAVQAQKREDKVKAKVNAAPRNDEQAIPRRLQNLMKARDEVKSGRYEAREKERLLARKKAKDAQGELLDSSKFITSEPWLKGMKRPLKPIPVFKQKPGESKKRFFNRMENQVKNVLKEKSYEDKYDVEIVRDQEGHATVQERQKDELELEVESKRNAKLAKKGIVVRSKEEKRKLKRLKEKEKRLKKKRRLSKLLNADGNVVNSDDEEKDFEHEKYKDKVEFGEVANAPPSMKRVKGWKDQKPAERGGLLLQKKLESNKKKAKTRAVSLAQQSILDEERQRVISEYRSLKMNKVKKIKH